ncbi:MAG TPA: PA14 domain-containing protein [Victivallales bacterium]|nr:PA14 domain-containing protein [Victivallales bacterium]
MIKVSIVTILFISLFSVYLFAEDVSLNRISPKGKSVYEEKKDDYPPFELEKYQKEAESKYPMVKIGDEITISTRRNTYRGKFGGVKGNTIIVGDKVLPTVDIPPGELTKYSEELNKKARDAYISKFRNEYNAKRIEYRENLKEEIYLKYPALDSKKINSLFSKISDKDAKAKYIEFYEKQYEESLPLENKSIEQLENELTEKLVSTFPELCFSEDYFWNKKEKEEAERRIRELLKAKFERAQKRALFPKTSSPVFEPDGGIFAPDLSVKIFSSTDGAVIYYTTDGSEPTELSNKYTEPILLKKPQIIRAIAYHSDYQDSDITVIGAWAGGVFASYFETMTFRGKTVERVDPEIDFKSGGKSPIKGQIPDHLFSIIWAGQIIPKTSGEYEIFLTTDDGTRMWLDGLLLIDAWKEQPPTEYKKKFRFEAGKRYDFKIAFTEVMGFAECKLEWQTESISRQVIPQECLFPEGRYVEELKKWNKKTIQGSEEIYVNRQNMKNPGEFMGNFKLPVRGGQARWDQLGIK